MKRVLLVVCLLGTSIPIFCMERGEFFCNGSRKDVRRNGVIPDEREMETVVSTLHARERVEVVDKKFALGVLFEVARNADQSIGAIAHTLSQKKVGRKMLTQLLWTPLDDNATTFMHVIAQTGNLSLFLYLILHTELTGKHMRELLHKKHREGTPPTVAKAKHDEVKEAGYAAQSSRHRAMLYRLMVILASTERHKDILILRNDLIARSIEVLSYFLKFPDFEEEVSEAISLLSVRLGESTLQVFDSVPRQELEAGLEIGFITELKSWDDEVGSDNASDTTLVQDSSGSFDDKS